MMARNDLACALTRACSTTPLRVDKIAAILRARIAIMTSRSIGAARLNGNRWATPSIIALDTLPLTVYTLG
jgi:hypothetical protein